ncbi:hypothetical protein SAMN05444166_4560 [Singulisphaera sp. GP187]|uniref:hypothetical protein n=1 Tax=Singulisphaera sp. GP187 TaxID=1882752 RepID=UPI0009260EBB|nr:hypothetical protein [Singulisphaera sp. GP187]SIO42037.1 hypothetical protein SAMN05444166_4560 [Singulisphaera sp. GP187]
MRQRYRWCAAPLVAAVLLALGGCGAETSSSVGAPPTDNTVELDSSKDKVSISGTVNVGGKAATGGEVTLDPKTSSRSAVETVKSPIGKDGSYSAKTYVGTNHISVTVPGMTAEQKAHFIAKILQPTDSKVDIEIP